jgi:anthranilate/para-aminobenzoate synthase component II
MTAWT